MGKNKLTNTYNSSAMSKLDRTEIEASLNLFHPNGLPINVFKEKL